MSRASSVKRGHKSELDNPPPPTTKIAPPSTTKIAPPPKTVARDRLALPKSPKETKDSRSPSVSRKSKKLREKFQFEVWPREVSGVSEEVVGRTVYILWQRGTKANSGNTKRALVNNNKQSTWDEKFIFEASLERIKENEYKACNLSLKLRDERKQKDIARCELDLTKFRRDNGVSIHTHFFKGDKIQLKFRIKATLLRVNGQRIVRALDIKDANPQDPHHYIEGDHAYVTQTDTNVDMTDNTDNTLSDNTEKESFFDSSHDEESALPTVQPTVNAKARVPRSTVKVTPVMTESSEHMPPNRRKKDKPTGGMGSSKSEMRSFEEVEDLRKIIDKKDQANRNSESEIAFLRQKISTIEQQNKNYKKRCELLEEQVKEKGAQVPETINRVHELVDIDDLKEKNQMLEGKNRELQLKVEQLHEQLQQQLEHLKASQQTLTRKKTDKNSKRSRARKDSPARSNSNQSGGNSSPKAPDKPSPPQSSGPPSARSPQPFSIRKGSPHVPLLTVSSVDDDAVEEEDEESDEIEDILARLNFSDPAVLTRLKVRLMMQEQLLDGDLDPSRKSGEEFILKNMINTIYQSDQVLVKNNKIIPDLQIPIISANILELLSNEGALTDSKPRLLESMVKGLRSMIMKTIPISSLESGVYWLSTCVVTRHYLFREKASHLNAFAKEIEQLIVVSINRLLALFKESLSPMISVFFTLEDSSVKRVVPSAQTVTVNQVVHYFSEVLGAMRKYSLPVQLIRQLMGSLTFSLNNLLFNYFMTNPEICTTATAFQIKIGLSIVDEWLSNKAHRQLLGVNIGDKLAHIKEAATVASLEKSVFSDKEMIKAIAPSLNIIQIRDIVLNFRPKTGAELPAPLSVTSMLEKMCSEAVSLGFAKELKEEVIQNLNLAFLEEPLKQITQ